VTTNDRNFRLDYDIVVYGATGFVGRLVVDYLARRVPGGTLRWAIAGRDRRRLEIVRANAGATPDMLVADSQNPPSVDAVCARTRILLNTAGPFALYGGSVVDACVRARTHYVDITGETPWVRGLIERHHQRASAEGTRIVPCCGFDSVPSDLGSYLIVRTMQREFGLPCKLAKGYFRMSGGINGGTVATALHGYESGAAQQQRDPFLLDPPHARTRKQIEGNRDAAGALYDSDIECWVGPFVMAPINTRVVRRSAALFDAWHEGYGPDFAYQEYVKYEPPFARLKAGAATAGLGLLAWAMHSATGRGVLRRLLPKPGEGPSAQSRNAGGFVCEMLGIAGDGRRAQAVMRHRGDPSNQATVRFVCESALCLALHEADLPGGHGRGGVLTPATALGDVLAGRLRQSGMPIEITL
jgi:short subunit dehydrogenase-like uncharacterized protein